MVTAVIVPGVRTGDVGRDVWIRTRHQALVDELIRRGYEPTQAFRIALAPVAHWGHETGWGRSEWGFNIGNIRSVGQCAKAHLLKGPDDAVPSPYCDYDSLQLGVAATLDLLLRDRYQAAWQRLVATGDGPAWFNLLMRPPDGRAGWHPWSQQSLDDYQSEYDRVARTVGAPLPPQVLAESGVPLRNVVIAGGLGVALMELWRRRRRLWS